MALANGNEYGLGYDGLHIAPDRRIDSARHADRANNIEPSEQDRLDRVLEILATDKNPETAVHSGAVDSNRPQRRAKRNRPAPSRHHKSGDLNFLFWLLVWGAGVFGLMRLAANLVFELRSMGII